MGTVRDRECGPGPWYVVVLDRFQEGPPPWGTGHSDAHLALELVDELLETVDLEPPLHLSLRTAPWGWGPRGKLGWEVSQDELKGSEGAGIGGTALDPPQPALPPTTGTPVSEEPGDQVGDRLMLRKPLRPARRLPWGLLCTTALSSSDLREVEAQSTAGRPSGTSKQGEAGVG